MSKKMISVNEATYNRLAKRGSYHESMDKIINAALDVVEQVEKRKEVNIKR